VADDLDEFVAVGRVGPARGVRGDVFVEPWTDVPAERFAVGAVLRTEPAAAGPLTVETSSLAGGKLVVRFAGVDDRAGAEALRGVQLLFPAGERPALDDPDEFYDTDLIGLAARSPDGAELGRIGDVAAHGEGAPSALADLGSGRLDLLLGARGADHVAAHLGDAERDRLADAAPGAGHDRDLIRHPKSIE